VSLVSAHDILNELTRVEEKAVRYAAEVYFREAWEDLTLVAGDAAATLAHQHALVLFKPDGIAFGAASPTLELLAEEGFTAVVARPIDHPQRHPVSERCHD
jgi:hypothetical protein